MKRLLSLLLVVLFVFAAGCTSNAPAPSKTDAPDAPKAEQTQPDAEKTEPEADAPYIIYIHESATIVFQKLCQDSFIKMCEANGIRYDILDGNKDPSAQISCVETAILMEPDAVIMCVCSGAETALPKFNEAGIPLVLIDRYPDLEGIEDLDFVYVGVDDYSMGKLWGEYLSEVLEENAEYCFLMSKYGNPSHMDRRQGFLDVIEKNRPDVKQLDEQLSQSDATTGANVVEDWITKFGDRIDAIISPSGGAAIGVCEVLVSKGKTDDILFCTNDLLHCSNLESGAIDFDLFQNSDLYAETAIDAALKMINGEDMAGTEIKLEPMPITVENYEAYKEIRP